MAVKKRPTAKQKGKVEAVMSEYKRGELNIGKSEKKVKKKEQAVAIALKQAGLSKNKKKSKKK